MIVEEMRRDQISDNLAKVPFVGLWTPIWLGWLNEGGEISQAFGPYGNVRADYNFTKAVLRDGQGVLMYRAVKAERQAIFIRPLRIQG